MFDSTFPPSAQLQPLQDLEPWRANAIGIGLDLVLLAARLPEWAQVPFATITTRSVRLIAHAMSTISRTAYQWLVG